MERVQASPCLDLHEASDRLDEVGVHLPRRRARQSVGEHKFPASAGQREIRTKGAGNLCIEYARIYLTPNGVESAECPGCMHRPAGIQKEPGNPQKRYVTLHVILNDVEQILRSHSADRAARPVFLTSQALRF